MRVAISAPYLTPENGGIRNFTQWIVSRVGAVTDMLLVAPTDLIDETSILAEHAFPSASVDDLRCKMLESMVYRLLERESRGRWLGIQLPFYKRGTERLRRRFMADSLLSWNIGRVIRRFGADLVHIPTQHFNVDEAAGLPFILNPHDYQHEHLPQFFTDDVLRLRREVWYPVQRRAAAIVTHSRQTRDDAINFAGIAERKVFYAPYGAIKGFPDLGEDGARTLARSIGLPDRFIFYPARMWGHKNHIGLLKALAVLKEKGTVISCVFTRGGDCEDEVREVIARLGMDEQVLITGSLNQDEMGAAFKLSELVVVPSLFEQNSGPMLEAIHFGRAVAVSNIPELAHTLGADGLVFDPDDIESIAGAIEQVWVNSDRRLALEAHSRRLSTGLSWMPFLDCYREAYEFAARSN